MVHNGVPFDLAFSMEHDMRAGLSIIFASFHGRKFDFDSMTFDGDD